MGKLIADAGWMTKNQIVRSLSMFRETRFSFPASDGPTAAWVTRQLDGFTPEERNVQFGIAGEKGSKVLLRMAYSPETVAEIKRRLAALPVAAQDLVDYYDYEGISFMLEKEQDKENREEVRKALVGKRGRYARRNDGTVRKFYPQDVCMTVAEALNVSPSRFIRK